MTVFVSSKERLSALRSQWPSVSSFTISAVTGRGGLEHRDCRNSRSAEERGWLMGKFGLALDNLSGVELVTAEGKVLRASHDEEPDLCWAVRGGGGNFGIVTAFEYQLHPVGPTVTARP